ncbi:MAG: WYL domain-containing protein [Clostridia bacterium]|nr:WYL domain-containing protein [Clostridia bacterium]
MYERLNKGERLNKQKLADEYGVSAKTVQRDFDDLRAYISENHFDEGEASIKYNKADNCYYLVRFEREWLTNEEALALCKIILESRAFSKKELSVLIEKLILQIAPDDRRIAEKIIRSEYHNYIPLQHGKELLSPLWRLSRYITDKKVIEFDYIRQDGKKAHKTVKPVSILFSEFYFYLIVFDAQQRIDHPVVYRVDRIENVRPTGESFDIPYRSRFNEGEFRKRIQFMYMGELKTVTFEYSGVLEAILDKVPTARILSQNGKTYVISAETYGDGIYMWLRAQGDKAKILQN